MARVFPYLTEDVLFPFPSVEDSTEEGIVAQGGNLSPGMLLSAYRQGIFPWFSDDEPILWWSPDPRFVLFPEKLHVSESMRKVFKKGRFKITVDHRFRDVITMCGDVKRAGQQGTWITREMIEAYVEMHRLGYAHSVEAWADGKLAGGLYGISLGGCFFGESMFSLQPNASKAAFITLVLFLMDRGVALVDSQVYTPHLASLGAEEIPRDRYLELLVGCLEVSTLKGAWSGLFPEFPASERLSALLAGSGSNIDRTLQSL